MNGNASARWVSWHQLLIDYQFSSARAGPRNIGRRWRNVGYKQADYSFCAHAKWFSHYFQNLGRALSIKPDVRTMRPPSHVLTYWGGSVRVQISNGTFRSGRFLFWKSGRPGSLLVTSHVTCVMSRGQSRREFSLATHKMWHWADSCCDFSARCPKRKWESGFWSLLTWLQVFFLFSYVPRWWTTALFGGGLT